MNTYVITFDSTECAMDASDALAAAGVRFRTLPTPLAISAGCGIALRIDTDEAAVVSHAAGVIAKTECGVAGGSVALYAIYRRVDEEYQRVEGL